MLHCYSNTDPSVLNALKHRWAFIPNNTDLSRPSDPSTDLYGRSDPLTRIFLRKGLGANMPLRTGANWLNACPEYSTPITKRNESATLYSLTASSAAGKLAIINEPRRSSGPRACSSVHARKSNGGICCCRLSASVSVGSLLCPHLRVISGRIRNSNSGWR